MKKLLKYVLCALFLLNVCSARSFPFEESHISSGIERNTINSLQNYQSNRTFSPYSPFSPGTSSGVPSTKPLYGGRFYTSANDLFGGVTTMDDIDERAYEHADLSSPQYRTIAPPIEAPLGDPIVPLLLMLVAYAVWKQRKTHASRSTSK